VTASYEHDNETLPSIKDGEFRDSSYKLKLNSILVLNYYRNITLRTQDL
jgi:hypothetical protein